MKTNMELLKSEVKKCIYEENSFSLVNISESLIQSGKELLKDVFNNGMLNLNALYKNFIDDCYEHYHEIQSHQIKERNLGNGSLLLEMQAFNKYTEVVRAYSIELRETA